MHDRRQLGWSKGSTTRQPGRPKAGSTARWRTRPSACAPLALAGALILGGCAATAVKPPRAPDESALAPARRALARASGAHADDFAPEAVDAARRRLTAARDIVFSAARAGRRLNDAESQRERALVAAAKLDARSALVQTQAKAVRAQVASLRKSTATQPPAAKPADTSAIGRLDDGFGLGPLPDGS